MTISINVMNVINQTHNCKIAKISTLSGLSVSYGTFNPGFSVNTFSYSMIVGGSITCFVVSASVADNTATLRINNQVATSVTVALSVGSNPISVQVTAQDGITVSTYVITVTRRAATLYEVKSMTC